MLAAQKHRVGYERARMKLVRGEGDRYVFHLRQAGPSAVGEQVVSSPRHGPVSDGAAPSVAPAALKLSRFDPPRFEGWGRIQHPAPIKGDALGPAEHKREVVLGHQHVRGSP